MPVLARKVVTRIRRYLAAAMAFGLIFSAAAQVRSKAPAKKPATAKKKSGTATKKPTTPKKAATPSTKAPRSKSSSSGSRAKARRTTKKAPAARGQQRPTPERYKEIEEALAARGYLSVEPSGKWPPAAVDALKNFQADHELPPTGRLDALSLIRLGLGPKE